MAETLSADKEQKYDRQLRLWGRDGQIRLEKAHICVLGSNAAATETVKNLVLPGIGKVTIIDNKNVTGRDLGSNFFVVHDSLGKSRATETAKYLHELNDDVELVEGIHADPVHLINNEPTFIKKYSLIVATELPQAALLKLGELCQQAHIPLLVLNIYGFVGWLRTVLPEHDIIESKPDFPPSDLRISDPFPELLTYVNTWNFDSLNSTQHAHIPFPVILVKAIEAWKASHGGALPANTKEKDEFKKSILALSWKAEEQNFAEAHNAALQAFIPYSIPSQVQAVLDDAKANPDNITADSTPFWILAAAVRLFVQKEGHGKFLPLMGAIPDMEAETNTYIDLQNVYKHKSEADQAAVRAHVNTILTRVGKAPTTISDDLLTMFCKNALFIRVFRYRSLAEEFNPETSTVGESSWQLEDTASNNLHWYLLIRAALRFEQQHGRLPSSNVAADGMQDYNEYKNHVQAVLKDHGLAEDAISNDFVKEFCRYGGSQLHNLGAILGGVASQEILKITTKQWIPVNNTYIFNGMNSNSSSFEF